MTIRVAFGALVMVAFALVVYGVRGATIDPPSTATPPLPSAPPPRPPAAWLGLNYNSAPSSGGTTDFAARGIVYDREGALETEAGRTVASSARLRTGLQRAYSSGMVPVLQVDTDAGRLGCVTNPVPSHRCLPTRPDDIASYVQGFTQLAVSVRNAFPGRKVLLEPADEPWAWADPPGTAPGRTAASQYALILARLLPSARAAGLPLNEIYVPAVGVLADGSSWIADLYRAQPCLAPGPRSCGPVAGWNVHPYGLPHSTTEGIDMVPGLRRQVRSGQDNIIVSEIGFCATDVNGGAGCDHNQPDVDGTSSQAAAWLLSTLTEAASMHRAGWLRALILWDRGGRNGWAMQQPDGRLTAQGHVLDVFAGSSAAR